MDTIVGLLGVSILASFAFMIFKAAVYVGACVDREKKQMKCDKERVEERLRKFGY